MRLIITEKNIGDWAAVYVARKILDVITSYSIHYTKLYEN